MRSAVVIAALAACGTAEPAAPATPPTATVAVADAAPGPDASARRHPRPPDKHMVWDEGDDGGVAPIDHPELLWGDYVDRDGKPSVGWHSHHPLTGNAR